MNVSDMPLRAYLAQWLETQRAYLQPSTWASYQMNVECYLVPALGDVPVGDLRPAQLNALYSRLLDSGARKGRPLSLTTVRYCHGVLRKALEDAVRLEELPRNVCARVKLPRRDVRADAPTEVKAWTAEQLRTFLAATSNDRFGALWHIAATTGLRRGEMLGLRWQDVDLDGCILTVRRSLTMIDKQPRLKQPKTSRCRTLRIDAGTAEVLRARRRHAEQCAVPGAWSNPWDLVFTHDDGSPIDPMLVTQAFIRTVARMSLPRIRLHDLRHTHATLLLQAGVPVKVVSERLGHAQISLTLDIYAHVLPAMDADAADRFADVVFSDRRLTRTSEGSK